MRILMLGNSFIFTNNMPQMLADLTGAEVVHHTRGGARLSEQQACHYRRCRYVWLEDACTVQPAPYDGNEGAGSQCDKCCIL